MSQELFTRKEVTALLDNLLQYPDQLLDAVSNENTDWTADSLLDLTESSLPPEEKNTSVTEGKEETPESLKLLTLVDNVWNHATESKQVPATKTAIELILKSGFDFPMHFNRYKHNEKERLEGTKDA